MNILQQIIELGTETHDAAAVASVVAMAPGTVTVVKQVRAPRPHLLNTVSLHCHPPSVFRGFHFPKESLAWNWCSLELSFFCL